MRLQPKHWPVVMGCARLVKEQGVQCLQLETDCQVLVNLWKRRSNQKSEIVPLLQMMEDLSRSIEGFSLIINHKRSIKFNSFVLNVYGLVTVH